MLMTEVDADVTTRAVVRLLLTLVLTLSAFECTPRPSRLDQLSSSGPTPHAIDHGARISDRAAGALILRRLGLSRSEVDRVDGASAPGDLNSYRRAILRSTPDRSSCTRRQTLTSKGVFVQRLGLAT